MMTDERSLKHLRPIDHVTHISCGAHDMMTDERSLKRIRPDRKAQ